MSPAEAYKTQLLTPPGELWGGGSDGRSQPSTNKAEHDFLPRNRCKVTNSGVEPVESQVYHH